ncbi:MAG TPA: HAD family phosphatase [Thermoanaerobaculia bacterium]|nr:HAD family phosphatase [Thermoanaerobaculia bacterium]
MLRAILFGFNGVLLDDEPIHFELFARVLAEEGIALSSEESYRRYLALDDRSFCTEALVAAGQAADTARVVRLITRKASYYRERLRREGYPFFPGVLARIVEAGRLELALGIVSGALREEVEGALEQAAVRSLFKVLVTAEDVADSKPDPQGYQRALEALNSLPPLPDRLFHPHEVLAIEDSPAGLAAAGGAGLATLGVAQTHPADRLAAADQVVERLGEVNWQRLLPLYG